MHYVPSKRTLPPFPASGRTSLTPAIPKRTKHHVPRRVARVNASTQRLIYASLGTTAGQPKWAPVGELLRQAKPGFFGSIPHGHPPRFFSARSQTFSDEMRGRPQNRAVSTLSQDLGVRQSSYAQPSLCMIAAPCQPQDYRLSAFRRHGGHDDACALHITKQALVRGAGVHCKFCFFSQLFLLTFHFIN